MGQCDVVKVTVVNLEVRLNGTSPCERKEPWMQLRGRLSGADCKPGTLRSTAAQTWKAAC